MDRAFSPLACRWTLLLGRSPKLERHWAFGPQEFSFCSPESRAADENCRNLDSELSQHRFHLRLRTFVVLSDRKLQPTLEGDARGGPISQAELTFT